MTHHKPLAALDAEIVDAANNLIHGDKAHAPWDLQAEATTRLKRAVRARDEALAGPTPQGTEAAFAAGEDDSDQILGGPSMDRDPDERPRLRPWQEPLVGEMWDGKSW